MSDPTRECVILGSGRSVLRLGDAERAYLNAHPNTLAMNKFLVFHEKAGVAPKAVFLADSHGPAPLVFVDLVRAAARLRPRPRFFVHRDYEGLFRTPSPLRPRAWKRFLGDRRRFRRRRGFGLPVFLPRFEATYFDSRPELNGRPLFWARSLDEELYYHRGSLTTALNLAAVAYPGVETIKLVGVDLDGDRSFFAEEMARRPEYTDRQHDHVAERAGQHVTAIPLRGFEPIQAVIPAIVERLSRDGIELVNANPESLFCREGLCRHEPIVPEPTPAGAGPGPDRDREACP